MEYLLIVGSITALLGVVAAIIGRKQVKQLERKHRTAHK